MIRWTTAFLATTLLSAPAVAADEIIHHRSDGPEFGVGARIGGYGFREVKEGALSWADCRMNGTGLFGTVDVGKHFFGEVSTDLYHSIGTSPDMDRVSFLPSASVGARLFAGKLITPYVQAGGGPEFTRITLMGVSERKVLGTAFMGVGGELNIKRFHFGSNIKVFTMGIPEHSHGTVSARLEPPDAHEHAHDDHQITMRSELAAMMQFFVRYSF